MKASENTPPKLAGFAFSLALKGSGSPTAAGA
jgi:hypothetical protein